MALATPLNSRRILKSSLDPTDAEYAEVNDVLADVADNDIRPVLGDVLWALMNSAEFTLNH